MFAKLKLKQKENNRKAEQKSHKLVKNQNFVKKKTKNKKQKKHQ